jgi:hypothetical protein
LSWLASNQNPRYFYLQVQGIADVSHLANFFIFILIVLDQNIDNKSMSEAGELYSF